MQRRGGGVFCRAAYPTHLLSWQPAETFHLCTLHENSTRKQILNGSSAGCLLCKPTAPCWSSQLQDLGHHCEDSRPQSPLHPVCVLRPDLARLHSSPWMFSSMIGKVPSLGLPRKTSISNQAHRQVSKARNRNMSRSCQKNDMTGAKQCLPAFLLSVQDVLWQSFACGRADGMYVTGSEGLWEMHCNKDRVLFILEWEETYCVHIN